MRNKDLVTTSGNEVYDRGEDNSARQSPTPTDNAERNSVGTEKSLSKQTSDVNGQATLHAGGGAASPSYPRRNFVAGRRLVAEDYGRGERTPGALAASRELDMTRATPISQYGTVRKMSLPLSEILHLHRALTGEASPARLVKNAKGGALEGATRTLADRVAMVVKGSQN